MELMSFANSNMILIKIHRTFQQEFLGVFPNDALKNFFIVEYFRFNAAFLSWYPLMTVHNK